MQPIKTTSEIIKEFSVSKNDTGSSNVQIALLTYTINHLSQHIITHKKDIPAKRTLLKKVAQRKRFLNYLMINDYESYKILLKKLNLKK